MTWWKRFLDWITPYCMVIMGAGCLMMAVGFAIEEQRLASGPPVEGWVVSVGMQPGKKRPVCMASYRYMADRERFGSERVADEWCGVLRPGDAIKVLYDRASPDRSRPEERYLRNSPSTLVALFGLCGLAFSGNGVWVLGKRWRPFFAKFLPERSRVRTHEVPAGASRGLRRRHWREPCPCGSGRQWRKCCPGAS